MSCIICGSKKDYNSDIVVSPNGILSYPIDMSKIMVTMEIYTDEYHSLCDMCISELKSINSCIFADIDNAIKSIAEIGQIYGEIFKECELSEVNIGGRWYKIKLSTCSYDESIRRLNIIRKTAELNLIKEVDIYMNFIKENATNVLLDTFENESLILKAKERNNVTFTLISKITKVPTAKVSKLLKDSSFNFREFSNLNETIELVIKNRDK